jgi:hypothetical protein
MSINTDTTKEYEQVMPFHLPSVEDMDEAVYTLGLSKASRACLADLLVEIDEDIKEQKLYLSNNLTRDEAIKKLKDVEKAAKMFRDVLAENQNILPEFIPHQALEDIGKIFTFSAIVKAVGRDIRPVGPTKKMKQLIKSHKLQPEKPTKHKNKLAAEQLKRDAGHAYADKLLLHMLGAFIAPIDQWHEKRRQMNKGGRTINRSRRDFVLVLALKAEKIIGEKPSSDVKSKFFDLCELVFNICGVPTENLKEPLNKYHHSQIF